MLSHPDHLLAVAEGAGTASLVLAADDATVIGVLDDIAIPFVLGFAAGAALGYFLVSNSPQAVNRAIAATRRAVKTIEDVIAHTTVPQEQVTPEERTTEDKQRDCLRESLELNLMPCDEEAMGLDEYAIMEWLGGDPDRMVGEAQALQSVGPGQIDDCNKAPAEYYHVIDKEGGYLSISGCMCCEKDGRTSFRNWRGHKGGGL